MTIAGQDPWTFLTIVIYSFITGIARTVLIYTKEKELPKKVEYYVNIILSIFAGLVAGLVGAYFNLEEVPMLILVIAAALSAEKILLALPTIFVKKVETVVGVKPTEEDYERHSDIKKEGCDVQNKDK